MKKEKPMQKNPNNFEMVLNGFEYLQFKLPKTFNKTNMLLLEVYPHKCSVACGQFHQFRTLINEFIANIKKIVILILWFPEKTPL